MAKNGTKKLEKNTTVKRSGKIERRTAVIRVSEEEGNEGRRRRGEGQQEVAVSFITLVRGKKTR